MNKSDIMSFIWNLEISFIKGHDDFTGYLCISIEDYDKIKAELTKNEGI